MLPLIYSITSLFSNFLDVEQPPLSHSLNVRETIDTEKLQSLLTQEALEEWSHRVYEAANASVETVGHPTRVIGTAGHNASIDLILDTLDELKDYFTYELQPFCAVDYKLHNYTLVSDGEVLNAVPFKFSPAGNVSNAEVYFVKGNGCLPSDYEGTAGKIAVVTRGRCPFGEKSEIAGLSGAVGCLIWDPEIDNSEDVLTGGTLISPPLGHEVPTFGISANLAKSLNEGDKLSFYVNSTLKVVETVNIVAETIEGDHDNVVFAGAHSDSVYEGPGMNDNGSGMISLLEIAKQLSNFKPNNAIRLAWWSAEEEGLVGSLWYANNLTKEQASKIRLFLDFDMMASTNYIYEIYNSDDSVNPKGSTAIRDMFIDWYDKHDHPFLLQPFDGRSDYVGFVNIGIPSGGMDSGVELIKSEAEALLFGGTAGIPYDPCYHQACDDLDNVSFEPWLVNTKVMAHSIATYAESLEGFPKPDMSYFERRQPQLLYWVSSYI